ncbi:hypothetical protein JXM83_00055 [Candidatus Woesearchaeota archaeon]|nr:hypothetical protein [Candidatus Woesearchaeota archaeon]
MKKNILKKNKKGWIKIIEAFIALSLFTGMILLIVQNEPFKTYGRDHIENREIEILNAIQVNDTLRTDVLSVTNFELSSNDTAFPESLRNFISSNSYSNVECFLKVCEISQSCILDGIIHEEIYAKDVIITSSTDFYSPKKLKIFCLK